LLFGPLWIMMKDYLYYLYWVKDKASKEELTEEA